MLKKFALAIAMLLAATNVWAVKTVDVSNTVHNLGSGSPITGYLSQIEDEVCIFCHTPHGGTLDGPLWNRDLSATSSGNGTGFTHYASATLSDYMKGVSTRTVNSETLLCLSCHDGSVAMGTIINVNNRTGPITDVVVMLDEIFPGFGGSKRVGSGRDMSDDHPISFSYFEAYISNGGDGGKLEKVADARFAGIRFFGPDAAGGQRVECSSCHDPHVDYGPTGDEDYSPFLVMTNTGSALCLACHVK